MKLNKLFFVGLAVLGLMVSACSKHEVVIGKDDPKKGEPQTQAVKHDALAAKPTSSSVSYAFDSAALDVAGTAILDAYVAWLNDHGAIKVKVVGNCDQRGSREYNLALGQQRADGVKSYLVSHGVSASRIEALSNGEEDLVCSGTGEACWARNRRADIISH